MNTFMKIENEIEGATNFRAWNTRIDLALARHKILGIVLEKLLNQMIKLKMTSFKKMTSWQ